MRRPGGVLTSRLQKRRVLPSPPGAGLGMASPFKRRKWGDAPSAPPQEPRAPSSDTPIRTGTLEPQPPLRQHASSSSWPHSSSGSSHWPLTVPHKGDAAAPFMPALSDGGIQKAPVKTTLALDEAPQPTFTLPDYWGHTRPVGPGGRAWGGQPGTMTEAPPPPAGLHPSAGHLGHTKGLPFSLSAPQQEGSTLPSSQELLVRHHQLLGTPLSSASASPMAVLGAREPHQEQQGALSHSQHTMYVIQQATSMLNAQSARATPSVQHRDLSGVPAVSVHEKRRWGQGPSQESSPRQAMPSPGKGGEAAARHTTGPLQQRFEIDPGDLLTALRNLSNQKSLHRSLSLTEDLSHGTQLAAVPTQGMEGSRTSPLQLPVQPGPLGPLSQSRVPLGGSERAEAFAGQVNTTSMDSIPTTSVDPAWRRIQSLPSWKEPDARIAARSGNAAGALHREAVRGHIRRQLSDATPVVGKNQKDLVSARSLPEGSSVTGVAREEVSAEQPKKGLRDPDWPKVFGVYLVPERK